MIKGKKEVVRDWMPLVRFSALSTLNGELYATILRSLWDDDERREPTLEEITTAEGQEQLGLLLARWSSNMIYDGGLGILGDYYANHVDGWFTRAGRYKDPLPTPASVNLLKEMQNFLGNAYIRIRESEGNATSFVVSGIARDAGDMLRRIPVLRQAKALSQQPRRWAGMEEGGNPFARDLRLHEARKDQKAVRSLAQRFAKEHKLDRFDPLQRPQFAKHSRSELYDQVNDALLIGDDDGARRTIKKYIMGMTAQERKVVVSGLKASIRMRQPVTVSGVQKKDVRMAFAKWASKRAPTTFERMKRIHTTYMGAARRLGLAGN